VKPEGVFVTNVLKGSPAGDAGLRGGDIILRANNARVSTPIDLVRVIRVAVDNDRTVVLQIVRKHQPQSVTLRW
jgi:S1-C subfamily serine protease